jgi:hypothetical protein
MICELSRDYDRAWQLIQQGEKLACEYDRRIHRDVSKCTKSIDGTIAICSQMLVALYLPSDFDGFAKRCTELNIEFYLPIADKYTDLLIEIQPQIITNDAENDVNLAHIERLWNIENRTPEEEKIFDLLLLLSEQFESKAYPMESPWYAGLWYRVQAFMFRW